MWEGGPVCQAHSFRGLPGLKAHASSRRLTRTGLSRFRQSSGRSSGVEHNLGKVVLYP